MTSCIDLDFLDNEGYCSSFTKGGRRGADDAMNCFVNYCVL